MHNLNLEMNSKKKPQFIESKIQNPDLKNTLFPSMHF